MTATGMITWGNGEPCPICGKPFKKANFKHLEKEHKEEMMKLLFPEEEEE